MTRIIIPASAEEAEARLGELGPLATAIEWERGPSALSKAGVGVHSDAEPFKTHFRIQP